MASLDFNSNLDFELLLDDLTSLDYTSSEESCKTSEVIESALVPSQKTKHTRKKRKIDVICNNGDLVSFEAHFPRTRIVQTDIRRSYANMYVNTMNSGDFSMLFGFLDTFCSPSFNHSITRQFTMNSQLQTCSFFRNGIAACSQFWCYNFVTIPDSTIFLTDASIVTSDDGESSKIVAHYVFKATKILDCSPLWNDVFSDEKDDCKAIHNQYVGSSAMQDILKEVEEKVKELPLRAVPLPVVSRGQFIIYLDEHKRMTRMEMNSRAVQ